MKSAGVFLALSQKKTLQRTDGGKLFSRFHFKFTFNLYSNKLSKDYVHVGCVLRALPQNDRQIAAEEQVENVFRLERHFKPETSRMFTKVSFKSHHHYLPKSLADARMPECPELLIHRLLDGLGGQLVVLRVFLAGGCDHFDGLKLHVLAHIGMLKTGVAGSLMDFVYRWAWRRNRQGIPLCSIFLYGFNESIKRRREGMSPGLCSE